MKSWTLSILPPGKCTGKSSKSAVRKGVSRLREPGNQRVDIFFGCEAGKTDADCPVDHIAFQPDGFQHMAPPALLAGGAF